MGSRIRALPPSSSLFLPLTAYPYPISANMQHDVIDLDAAPVDHRELVVVLPLHRFGFDVGRLGVEHPVHVARELARRHFAVAVPIRVAREPRAQEVGEIPAG